MIMKKIFLIACMMLIASMMFADCRLMIVAGHGGVDLSTGTNYYVLEDALHTLESQSPQNPDGWGLVYYTPGNLQPDTIYRSEIQASLDPLYDTSVSTILNAHASTVIGHVRDASSGATTIPDPHPFVWAENGITYTFAHNGTLTPDTVTDINSWLVTPFNQPQTNVDSELYFLWIMQCIQQNNWNVVEGLRTALLALAPRSWNKNFIFTDGVDIYAYRKAIDSTHPLAFSPSTEHPGSPSMHNVRIVMSELPSTMNSIELPNDALLYYPANGRTTLLENFANSWTACTYKRSLDAGWNWESIPVSNSSNGNSNAEVVLGNLTDNGFSQLLAIDGSINYDSVYSTWEHYPTAFTNLNWNYLYKIEIGNNPVYWFADNTQYDGFETTGTIHPSNLPTLTNIQAYQDYWISYTLLPTQNMDAAFGDHWSSVYSVKSVDWTYLDMTSPDGGTIGSEPTPSMKMRALEFGKGYIVKFKDDISSFTWNYDRIPTTVQIPIKQTPQSFTYNEQPDYEAIDVLDIPAGVTEIGVFEGDTCVGAVVVDEPAEQILAYTTQANRNPVPLTFEYVTGRGSAEVIDSYLVWDASRNDFVPGDIFPGRQGYSIVKFGEIEKPQSTPTPSLSGCRCFPNPFNPSSRISFNLAMQQQVTVEVFNLKGQKVKTLSNGTLNAGEHNLIWNGTDEQGSIVASGLYFYRIKTSEQEISGKMLLMK